MSERVERDRIEEVKVTVADGETHIEEGHEPTSGDGSIAEGTRKVVKSDDGSIAVTIDSDPGHSNSEDDRP